MWKHKTPIDVLVRAQARADLEQRRFFMWIFVILSIIGLVVNIYLARIFGIGDSWPGVGLEVILIMSVFIFRKQAKQWKDFLENNPE
jgi:uncharacterized membrane protein YdjX (TVP38/TMEM64 family)